MVTICFQIIATKTKNRANYVNSDFFYLNQLGH